MGHALEIGRSGTVAAIDAYRLFGADEIADLIEKAWSIAEPGVAADGSFDTLNLTDDQNDVIDSFDASLPDDARLEEVFRVFLAHHPEQFAAT